MDRKSIINGFLEVVEGISDKEYQKRIWIRGEGPECDDFEETVCNFFQDGNGIIDKYKEFGLTEKQYQLLVKFRNKFEVFSDNNNWPAEFIDTPEWAEIMTMAKWVLTAFYYKKS